MARSDYTGSKFSRIVVLEGHEGEFYLIRLGANNSRVISTTNQSGAGMVVETSKIISTREVAPPTPAVGDSPVMEIAEQEAPVAVGTAPTEMAEISA
jgi:hypothetical protein